MYQHKQLPDSFFWDAHIDPIWLGLFLPSAGQERDILLMAGLAALELPADTAS